MLPNFGSRVADARANAPRKGNEANPVEKEGKPEFESDPLFHNQQDDTQSIFSNPDSV